MGLISLMRSVWNRMFQKEITEKFDTEVQLSALMEIWISKYYSITSGSPYWEDEEDDIKSINFGGYIGESTKSEIEYAKSKGKKISYLENCKKF